MKKGDKMTDEQRKRLSDAHKGHVPWNKGLKNWMDEETKKKANLKKIGKTPWNKGKKCPYMTERNLTNNPVKKGELNAFWKGGVGMYRKRQALTRDDYTCQICGLRDVEIAQVDHIRPRSVYPELENDINNLMTVCPNCHARKTLREKKVSYKKELLEQFYN